MTSTFGLDTAVGLIQNPECCPDLLLTDKEATADPRRMSRKLVLSHFLMGWGGCIQIDKELFQGLRGIGHGLLGDLAVAPRYTVLRLLASEIQMSTFPIRREKARRVGKSRGHTCHSH